MDKIIILESVSKYYRDAANSGHIGALEDISLEVNRGEIFGLLGPNGSGKTTLLKLMLGLIYPTKGRISVLGKSPRDVVSKNKIGYLPELPYFYDFLNPVELLRFYGSLFGMDSKTREKRIPLLIDRVGLNGFENRLLRSFSKGMLQRVGLAASLINNPQLLFLDEPTLGLDPIGTLEIQKLLRELNSQGSTIFLSSHLLSQVQDSCGRIGIIHKGRLLKTGRLEELLTVKDELEVVVRGMGEKEKESLKEIIREKGGQVVSISGRKESLKDLFIRVVGGEKKD